MADDTQDVNEPIEAIEEADENPPAAEVVGDNEPTPGDEAKADEVEPEEHKDELEAEKDEETPKEEKDKLKEAEKEEQKKIQAGSPMEKEKPEPPPKEGPKDMYLLELVIDQLNLDFCVSKELEYVDGQVCVSFKFFDNGPFDICEKDFDCQRDYALKELDGQVIKNGKSCLFSLTQRQVEEISNKFIVDIEINKVHDTYKYYIGSAMANVSLLFKDLLRQLESEETKAPGTSKTLKDCYKITDRTGLDFVGNVSIYIRLTAFGRQIVNQFQMNTKEMTVDFKANHGHYHFKYNKNKPEIPERVPCDKMFPQKTPCQLGLMPCNPPVCCHPPTSSPAPLCRPPGHNMPATGCEHVACNYRTTPCCSLPCDLGPKTCPAIQRDAEAQEDNPEIAQPSGEEKVVKKSALGAKAKGGKGKKAKGKGK